MPVEGMDEAAEHPKSEHRPWCYCLVIVIKGPSAACPEKDNTS